jgi:hypothetical protein
MMKLLRPVLVAAVVLGVLAPSSAHAVPTGAAFFRYWAFSDGGDLRDVILLYAPGPYHVALEYWDFAREDTEDQFRPEAAIHLFDRRRSVYHFGWRHEGYQERIWIGTDQVLSSHFVGRAEVSPILADDGTHSVLSVGLDYYYGSYNFLSATVIRDPREDDLWIVPMRARIANEANDWLQVTVAPASERSIGWAVDAKIKLLRVGVERNSRYDFTNVDNFITTVGIEFPLRPRE